MSLPKRLIPLFINIILNRKPLLVYDMSKNDVTTFVVDSARAIDVILHNATIAEAHNSRV